jgi:hypothetical protein
MIYTYYSGAHSCRALFLNKYEPTQSEDKKSFKLKDPDFESPLAWLDRTRLCNEFIFEFLFFFFFADEGAGSAAAGLAGLLLLDETDATTGATCCRDGGAEVAKPDSFTGSAAVGTVVFDAEAGL